MRGQLLIVDEAGMMSTRDMTQLMGIAEKNDNRVLFLGDYRQHSSVDAGDAFRLLQSEGGIKYAELTENRRQKDEDYRKAVDLIGSGVAEKAQKGMKILDKKGWIIEMPDEARRQDLLVGEFLKASDEGASALIVGTTNREGEEITGRLREALKSRGKISGEERFFPSRMLRTGRTRKRETAGIISRECWWNFIRRRGAFARASREARYRRRI